MLERILSLLRKKVLPASGKRIFVRVDSDNVEKITDMLLKFDGEAEFDLSFQAETNKFVFDIKTKDQYYFSKMNSAIKKLGIKDTKSIKIIKWKR